MRGDAHASNLVRTAVVQGQQSPDLPPGVRINWLTPPRLSESGFTRFAGAATLGFGGPGASWIEEAAGLRLTTIQASPLAPNSPFHSYADYPLGNEAGLSAFNGYYEGTGHPVSGIWIASPSEIRNVAMSGAPSPGGGNFRILGEVAINRAGDVAFKGDTLFPYVEAVWRTVDGALIRVATSGEAVPGSSPVSTLGQITSYAQLNDLNETYFTGLLKHATGYQYAILRHTPEIGFAPVLKTGDPAPGLPLGNTIEVFHFTRPRLAAGGGISLIGDVRGTEVTAANRYAAWAGPDVDHLRLVMRQGDPAPGFDGEIFTVMDTPEVNDFGGIAVRAGRTDGGINPVTGSVSGNQHGDLWEQDAAGKLRLVVQQGQQAPGLSNGVVFAAFGATLAYGGYSINNAGQVAFLAWLTGPGVDSSNDASIWVEDRGGNLRLVARTGQPIPFDDNPGVGAPIPTRIDAILGGQYDAFNNAGQLAFRAMFTDGSARILVSNVGAAPEPSGEMSLATALILQLSAIRRVRREG